MSIFISYRRSDTQSTVGRLYDHLERRVGAHAVFKDTHSISIGADVKEAISRRLHQSEVFLAVIGPDWLSAKDDAHRRRIDDPKDWVRMEIETALEENANVVPILVDNARMPQPDHLPPSMARLADLQHTKLRQDPDFVGDIERLLTRLSVPPVTSQHQRHTDAISQTAQRMLLISINTKTELKAELRYTLLLGSPEATVPSLVSEIRFDEIEIFYKDIYSEIKQFNSVEILNNITQKIIHPEVLNFLSAEESHYTILFNDRLSASLPWEFLSVNGAIPAITGGISRRLMSAHSGQTISRMTKRKELPSLLIVSDPTGDLPGAHTEGIMLAELASGVGIKSVDFLSGNEVTEKNIRECLKRNRNSIIHYSGHAMFSDRRGLHEAGLLLADNNFLSPDTIFSLGIDSPELIFISASEAARFGADDTRGITSLSEAFMTAGTRNLIAPLIPISDMGTSEFVERFYSVLFRGSTFGTAMREAKLALWQKRNFEALGWVHFGLPENVLVHPAPVQHSRYGGLG